MTQFSEYPELSNHQQQSFNPSFDKTIFVVDDVLENLQLLKNLLTQQGYKVRCGSNGKMALKAIQAYPPDLILLDINMVPMDGYEVSERLKAHSKTCDIPIIFLSVMDETFNKVRAFEVGGADYITKPFDVQEIVVRIEHQLKLQAAQSEIRRLNTELEQRIAERTAQLEASNQTLREEIERHRCTQQELMHLALYDPLLQIPNRTLFLQHLSQAIENLKFDPARQFAVFSVSCDRFKIINNSLGHQVGDQLLAIIAHRLKSYLPIGGFLARIGEDVFSILLEGIHTPEKIVPLVEGLQRAMKLPFQIEHHKIFIDVSIGIVLSHPSYQQAEHFLRDADIAMDQAKVSAQSYRIFNPEMHEQILNRFRLETELRQALAKQQFAIHYQPIVSLVTGKIKGFEALLRWRHPELGSVSPDQFIPLAEEIGLIIPIGHWVLRTACHQLQHWRQQSPHYEALTMSVNLSGRQLLQHGLLEQIDHILKETGLTGSSLNLEITESVLMDQATLTTWLLKQLRKRQIRLSIDDFGTGYSSMSYLQNFRAETLKLDRSFIGNICQSGKSLEIVKSMIQLGDNLGMTIVAEGIETPQQLNQLKQMSCLLGQGHLFYQPVEAALVPSLVRANHSSIYGKIKQSSCL